MRSVVLGDTDVAWTGTRAPAPGVCASIDLVPRTGPGSAVVCRQPVTLGVPFARGTCPVPSAIGLQANGAAMPLQTHVLERWPDGSVRWALFSFEADGGSASYTLGGGSLAIEQSSCGLVRNDESPGRISVNTGAARFRIETGGACPFAEVTVAGKPAMDPARSGMAVLDSKGRRCRIDVNRVEVEHDGPVRAVVRLDGVIRRRGRLLLDIEIRVEFFAGSSAVRIAATVANPRAARHPGGIWDLGDPGSVYIKNLEFVFAMPPGDAAAVTCSAHLNDPPRWVVQPLELYQDSSGGANWNSRNHVNHAGRVPTSFCGYRLHDGQSRAQGARATPYIALERPGARLSLAVQHFWENFPKGIEARDDALTLQLFPHQYSDLHEIQGGEQKTHRFTVSFGRDPLSDRLAEWGRSPAIPRAGVAQYCDGGVPHLSPAVETGELAAYERLARTAIEGPAAFEQTRELIDEYGWRNFGDIYANHEAVFAKGPDPLISHYNNQYDAVAGGALQFMRSGDVRWWRLMDELAAHVADIDIYHTTRDKPAYNGGLFWHTFHYVDAGRSTHRSYPGAEGVCGGGPSAEHSYASGLRLHYLLTGDPRSKAAAIGLARWIVAMDDGTATPMRWVSRGPTGLASATASADYHGPGRGPGHAILTLLEGHRLTNDPVLMAKAEELIRRCIHPHDHVDARELLDPERRWSYTAFLDALGRFLDYKIERNELDEMYGYARASLLLYARWMARHERPYLDHPELLEYPTETWAAQDMRKAEVFLLASCHAEEEERPALLERARFFFDYAVKKLPTMPTHTVARPVVLMLSHGYMYAYFLATNPHVAPPPRRPFAALAAPARFVGQKATVMGRIKKIPRVPVILCRFVIASLTK